MVVAIAFASLGFLIVHPEGLFNRHSDLLAFHLGTQTVLYDAWRTGHHRPLTPVGLLTIHSPEVLGTALDGSFVESWESVVYLGAIASMLLPAALAFARIGANGWL